MKIDFQILEKIEKVGSTNEKIELLKEFIIQGPSYEWFLKVAHSDRLLFMKDQSVYNALGAGDEVSGMDPGDIVFNKVDGETKIDQPLLNTFLNNLSEMSGNDQLNYFHDFITKLTPLHAKWVTRLVVKDLAMGVKIKLVNTALSELDRPTIDKHKVQLAGKFKDWRNKDEVLKRVSFPCLGEYKMDGYRIELRKRGDYIELMSRRGKKVKYAPEIIEAAKELIEVDTVILDGELICYDEEGNVDFNQIQQRSGRLPENMEPRQISFIAYDILQWDDMELETFSQQFRSQKLAEFYRLHKLQSQHLNYYHDSADWEKTLNKPFSLIKTVRLSNYESAKELYFDAVEAGFEGIILKRKSAPYKRGSRKNWWKIKKSSKDNLRDATLKVVDAKFGTGKNRNVISSLQIVDTSGMIKTWASNMKEHEMDIATERYENNTLIGSMIDVSYMEISKINKPWRLRHPVVERFRDDKDRPDNLYEEGNTDDKGFGDLGFC